MNEIDSINKVLNKPIIDTLETEVKKFANERSYWEKFLAEKILSGSTISDEDINTSYNYLLEELKLKEETQKPEIVIEYNANSSDNYKPDLLFTKLEEVEGVNALAEKQVIEFNPNLTIVYGVNGAGKSGYVRLFKKAFYSKSSEEIIPNVHLVSGHKPLNAKFSFKSNNTDVSLLYPANSSNAEFEQYSVFDGKSVIAHLDRKNEFEFRPAGLGFFSDFSDAISKVEQRNIAEIARRQSDNDLILLFDGESVIKDLIKGLSAHTKPQEIRKYVPFSNEDKSRREIIDKQYDDLLLSSRSKDKEIQTLENVKKLLEDNKKSIEDLNKYFNTVHLAETKKVISDFLIKEAVAKVEGVEKFNLDGIKEIGSEDWKNFILSARKFAEKQQSINYPENEDSCLLCHQPLSEDAIELINSYWVFIKSVAEENAKAAKSNLSKFKSEFEKLKFDLFPEGNMLTIWLSEKYPVFLTSIMKGLSSQKALSDAIISDILANDEILRAEVVINISEYNKIGLAIDNSIKIIREDGQSVELEKLLKEKTFFSHKEKLNTHLLKIEAYIESQSWIKCAGKANFGKRKITDTEKALSDKYFNQRYINTFNKECKDLNGNFGIEISHTGSAGKSYRQLKLKGRNPNAVLSEGEQKVIAIADFLSEMRLSEINRGIIFDDPVTSLDDIRKSEIAERLVKEASLKQVIIFTHDLVFVSSLIASCINLKVLFDCHWVKFFDNKPGVVWLKNTPTYEKEYKKSSKAQSFYDQAKKNGPEEGEQAIKNGFAALRTSYESIVVFSLFNGVVQRFNERVSIDSLKDVFFTTEIRDELMDGFYKCCSYMEGHLHSDRYSYKKPELENLKEEITRFNTIRTKIEDMRKKSA